MLLGPKAKKYFAVSRNNDTRQTQHSQKHDEYPAYLDKLSELPSHHHAEAEANDSE